MLKYLDNIKSQMLLNVPNNLYLPTPWSKIYNLSFLIKNKIKFPEDLQFGEDLIFNLDALQHCTQLSVDCESFYYYRNNVVSVSNSNNFDIARNHKLMMKKISKCLTKEYTLQKKVSIKYWIEDSIRIISSKPKAGSWKLKNMEKDIFARYSKKEIMYNAIGYKKKIMVLFLFLKAYGLISFMIRIKNKHHNSSKFIKI